MLISELFKNQLDGKSYKRIFSDKNMKVIELSTGYLYAEAVVPYSRSKDEFAESEEEIDHE